MESKANTKPFTVKATFQAHFSGGEYDDPFKFKSLITVNAEKEEDVDAEKVMEEFMKVLQITINYGGSKSGILFTSIKNGDYAGAINLSRVNYFDLDDWYVVQKKEDK